MAKKRPREVDKFEDIAEPVSSATVHAVATSLSPIKKGRRSLFFDGHLTDGKSSMRMVAFSERQHEVIQKFKEKKETMELRDVEFKHALRGEEIEVLLKSNSKICSSAKQIDVKGIEFDDGIAPDLTLMEVKTKALFSLVNVRAKVLDVGDTETLSNGYVKQDIIVTDSSGIGRVSLWGATVGSVEARKCYLFKAFMVKEFGGNKFLSMKKEESVVEKIADEIEDEFFDNGGVLEEATIAGVSQFDRRKICPRCSSTIEPGQGDPPVTGRCLKPECAMVVKYDACKRKWLQS